MVVAVSDQRQSVNVSGPAKLIFAPITKVVEVHDGDTFRVQVPLEVLWPDLAAGGFQPDVRVAHVNAPELSTSLGKAARTEVAAWLATHTLLRLHVWGREKYGRLLADVEASDGAMLSTYILSLDGSKPMSVRDQLVA